MIDDEILRARIPRLGTITVGRGVAATSRKGNEYARPTKSETFVFHSDDPQVATAVQNALGGDVLQDSPTWAYDVETDVREFDAVLLTSGFRQALELWRTAECVRRCDGVRMSTRDGRPTDEPCICAVEIDRGADRACSPSTILPVLVDLEVDRFGVWEVRSGSWGTAASLKGTLAALRMVGVDGQAPAVLRMVDRTVRDSEGKARDVVEIHATIAASQQALAAAATVAGEIEAGPPAALSPADAERLALMEEWTGAQGDVASLGLREPLLADWRERFVGRDNFDDLSVDELRGWLGHVRARLEDAREAVVEESAEAGQQTLDA